MNAVNETAMNGLFLSICSYVIFMILGFTIPEAYFKTQTSNPEIIDYGVKYLRVCLIASFGLFGGDSQNVNFNLLSTYIRTGSIMLW